LAAQCEALKLAKVKVMVIARTVQSVGSRGGCSMWITGFDVPTVSTVYLDKPMKNHTLMQTIARAKPTLPGPLWHLLIMAQAQPLHPQGREHLLCRWRIRAAETRQAGSCLV
jgi:hypothetical protein